MELNQQLTPKLKQLRLSGVLATLNARHHQGIDGQWAYVEFLERLLEDEIEWRAQKQLALRVWRATPNTTKTLGGFDWHFNFLTAPPVIRSRTASRDWNWVQTTTGSSPTRYMCSM